MSSEEMKLIGMARSYTEPHELDAARNEMEFMLSVCWPGVTTEWLELPPLAGRPGDIMWRASVPASRQPEGVTPEEWAAHNDVSRFEALKAQVEAGDNNTVLTATATSVQGPASAPAPETPQPTTPEPTQPPAPAPAPAEPVAETPQPTQAPAAPETPAPAPADPVPTAAPATPEPAAAPATPEPISVQTVPDQTAGPTEPAVVETVVTHPEANVHGLGPDVGTGPNPDFKPEPSAPPAEPPAPPAAPVVLIAPTIGRKLYFQPALDHNQGTAAGELVQRNTDPLQPLDATIIFVNDNRSIDLFVIDHNGTSHVVKNVPLIQDGEPSPLTMHAYWMPFQVGQAKKNA